MTVIAKFGPEAPPFVQSPEIESIDLPEDIIVAPDAPWYEQVTNGVIYTDSPIEVGEAERVKGDLMVPLRFIRHNLFDRVDRIEIWYGADALDSGEVTFFNSHDDQDVTILIEKA